MIDPMPLTMMSGVTLLFEDVEALLGFDGLLRGGIGAAFTCV